MARTYVSSVAMPRSGTLAVPECRDEYQSLCSEIGELRSLASTLTGLFAEMKREQSVQTGLMQRQNELLESLVATHTEPKSPTVLLTNLPILPAGQTTSDSRVVSQIPSPPNPCDADALSQAHDWVQTRLFALVRPAG